jgi:hypothetical protein
LPRPPRAWPASACSARTSASGRAALLLNAAAPRVGVTRPACVARGSPFGWWLT